ncbi:glycosyl transferase group 1 [Thioalkalivibrio sp. K90mix]|uniref:glycosyltransferase family 4 protein n=1 Tax=Thioalkalivibrio sp. (strain K90mix) TaxID=396595 RepID=UPI000195A967|nr:glycosyltransferase family 4 protein [Thioalkalivibrio sp. K90mix]ADC70828.1 glycosyl transferase group 1 [Thioalkalivibrio sp. K90mix]
MRIFHIVNLKTVAGIERAFCAFVSAEKMSSMQHYVASRGVSSRLAGTLHKNCERVFTPGVWRGSRFPLVPRRGIDREIKKRLSEVNPDVVISWSSATSVSALDWCARSNTPFIYWEHGRAWEEASRPSRVYATLLEQADRIICNSSASARMIGHFWRQGGKTTVVPNGLRPECSVAAPVVREFEGDAEVTVGFAGRLVPAKGAVVLVHALGLLRKSGVPVTLRIAGEGPEKEGIVAQIRRLGLSDVSMVVGFEDDMSRFYRGCDLVVCPSIREPFGLVSIEAQASGRPVIVSEVDGLPETIDVEKTGLAVRPSEAVGYLESLGGSTSPLPEFSYFPDRDVIGPPRVVSADDLAESIAKMITSPDFSKMSRRAASFAREEFSFDVHVSRVCKVLHDVVG